MTGTRDLTGLVASGRDTTPERTVAGPPPRRRAAARDSSPADAKEPDAGFDMGVAPATKRRAQRSQRTNPGRAPDVGTRTSAPSNTIRISVNIPVACKHWLAQEAREQQRFVSELLMDALDRHGATKRLPPAAVPSVPRYPTARSTTSSYLWRIASDSTTWSLARGRRDPHWSRRCSGVSLDLDPTARLVSAARSALRRSPTCGSTLRTLNTLWARSLSPRSGQSCLKRWSFITSVVQETSTSFAMMGSYHAGDEHGFRGGRARRHGARRTAQRRRGWSLPPRT